MKKLNIKQIKIFYNFTYKLSDRLQKSQNTETCNTYPAVGELLPSPVPEDSLFVTDFHMRLLLHGTSSAKRARTGHSADKKVNSVMAHKGGHKRDPQTDYNESAG